MSFEARRLTQAPTEPFVWESVAARPAGVAMADASTISVALASDQQMRLATLEREAFAKGHAQGERAGAEAAAIRADGMLRRLAQTIEELAELRGEIIRRTERQTVQLVLAIAERIVRREITLDKSILLGMARAALDRLGEYGTATIRLHPEDLAAISSAAQALDGTPVRAVADPAVSRGGCLVQSDFGFMDASPDAQFRELASALLTGADASPEHAKPDHGIVLT